MVIDADAINLISADTELKKWIPAQSILTPHPKEFERLVGTAGNSFENIQSAKTYAAENNVIIVLKGACTAIIDSEGNCYFNTTGNPGMATAGSGARQQNIE